MDAFVGRKAELKSLEAAYASRESAFVPVYGRRRVGKSELILKFMEGKPSLYFLGKKAPAELQIREFMEVAGRALRDPLLAAFPAKDWKNALETAMDRLPAGSKLVLALDEFQWMAEAAPELPSLLQELWDRRWKSSGNVFLILCGSYMGFMEREVLGRKSPLFGRRTGQLLLKPFGFREAALFHPRASLTWKAEAYFLCGGVPMYLKAFSQDASVAQNIEGGFLNEFSPLSREPDFLLREELREVEKYYAVLMALAGGALPSRDIARVTGVGDRALFYYLQSLAGLGYVGRRYPLAGGPKAARHVRYALADPLLRFWFRFVYPHQSLVASLGPQKAFAEVIKPHLDAYFGSCFEGLSREALPLIYAEEKVSSAFEVGEYWDKDVQIDVVGLREDGVADLGECKWGLIRSAAGILEELRRKAERYPNPKGRTIIQRLFAKEPPAHSPKDGPRVHSLKDMYALGAP